MLVQHFPLRLRHTRDFLEISLNPDQFLVLATKITNWNEVLGAAVALEGSACSPDFGVEFDGLHVIQVRDTLSGVNIHGLFSSRL